MGTARDLDGGHVVIPGIGRPGYHRLEMGRTGTVIAVAPARCPAVGERAGRAPAWMLGAQVYSLRRGNGKPGGSRGSATEVPPGWEAGGDYTAVGILARQAAAQGASGLAISPVHALFSADPGRYSPYAPSSRLFLNVLHADPAAVLGDELVRGAELARGPAPLSIGGLLDWSAIHAQRLGVLRRLHEHFSAVGPEGLLGDFEAFREAGGRTLADHACYEALHAQHAAALGAAHGWRDWPAHYHDPDAPAARRYAREHESELRFHAFLQWLAARNLAQAQASARAAGMPIGLVADMAVGTDARGSYAWCRRSRLMEGVSVGAPPDPFQPRGQNWGLSAFSPRASGRAGHDGYIETLRAVLAHAGGVRVDHVLGLARMWVIPAGAEAGEGVYLRYPRDELMDLLVLEAWRHQAVVVGENLGTVPEDFNEALAERGILGMNVLWFEHDHALARTPPLSERGEANPARNAAPRAPGQAGGEASAGAPRAVDAANDADAAEAVVFRSRAAWPEQAVAMVTTHDLPTLRGWWRGRDIQWRERLGQFDADQARAERARREGLKSALWRALRAAGLAESGLSTPQEPPVAAVLAYVAGTPAALCGIALEDLLGSEEQPNLPSPGGPAGADGHPDWRRVLEPAVEDMLADESVAALLQALRQARQAAGRGAASP